jgi:nicotinamidase-related amidase
MKRSSIYFFLTILVIAAIGSSRISNQQQDELPLPPFYLPSDVQRLYIERSELLAAQAASWIERYALQPAATDRFKIALFCIDGQISFCHPQASLFVPGAPADIQHIVEFMYRHLPHITTLIFSLDTHLIYQIFHPSWWVNAQGAHPAPFTAITAQDIETGAWRPLYAVEESKEYVRQLSKKGKYTLVIWPNHALLGGISHALVPALQEAAIFHALVRRVATHYQMKGSEPLTENYSVLAPEIESIFGKKLGSFNRRLFDLLMSHDRVYVCGEASSHCVRETLLDLKERCLAVDPALLRKIYILTDATSPVPAPKDAPAALNFPVIAQETFKSLEAAGMHLVRTTDPICIP